MSISTSVTLGASNGGRSRSRSDDTVATGTTRRRRAARAPKPVAIAVTRTSSPMPSSIAAPKMTFAFESAASRTTSAASSTSASPRSGPPVMLRRIPVAPSRVCSSSGDEIAARAASTARFSPRATPMPMSAEPASFMIVRTSAKSRLIRPGTVMRSVIPCTPCRRMSSAIRNASVTGVSGSTTCKSRSFSMTISASTESRSAWMPCSAWSARRLPSNPNGRVTTPTVSAPISRPISATTGAPPVPVPPPSPAVTKTMSAPLSASLSSSRLSSAAARPTLGSAPAPRPRVARDPMWIFSSASVMRSACASVLTATNSTPERPASTIRVTAFVPPPPMPTTLMTAR